MPSIYIISPRESAPSYFSSEVLEAWGIGRTPLIADLAVVTIAAFVPAHWKIAVCDERREDADTEFDCDIVALTGKVSQRQRMLELASHFHARGKMVVIGGPLASLEPESVRACADVLVLGEAEEIAAQVFEDIEAGRPRNEYRGGKPDLARSPLPRWDLYDSRIRFSGQVQTSRGCPFECEFCDVIQYLGRKQRWKEPNQVLAELQLLYGMGCRNVLLADDNFTVHRRRATELLEHILIWNEKHPGDRMTFATQLSIDVARSPDLMKLAAQAGLESCFIGIETPNEDSLIETAKRQNTRVDLVEELEKIAAAGIMPMCGMIVGFDNDRSDIFQRQADFLARTPVSNIMLGFLVAPAGTPLYQRMQAAGRLIEGGETEGIHFLHTNIKPSGMSKEEMREGMYWLLNQLYAPKAWISRLKRFVELAPRPSNATGRQVFSYHSIELAKKLIARGPDERWLLGELDEMAKSRPDLVSRLSYGLIYYCQARHMLEYGGLWDPGKSQCEAPFAA